MTTSSQYIEEQRKLYSLYTITSRAIPYSADGLKAAARRVLWTARDGKKYKSAALAGATMPIHPHTGPEGAINTLAAPYGNNIPLLTGIGAFGTILNPTAYGAARYTSVTVSEFTKDVVFRDIEIIPMTLNYDDSLDEPVYFLPLVPVALINPQSGIAVGFAASILPRDLGDIIKHQIAVLQDKGFKEPNPTFNPTNQRAVGKNGDRWVFRGTFKRINTTTIEITNLPYGAVHEKVMERLYDMEENGALVDVTDRSKDKFSIFVKFKRGELQKLSDEKIIKTLNLERAVTENLNVIDFEGSRVWSTPYETLIAEFTMWRLGWYKPRYERLAALLEEKIQRYRDILIAIDKNVGSKLKKTQTRADLKDYLKTLKIIHVDYIADLPIYRLTEDEKRKIEDKLKDALKTLEEYNSLISSEDARKQVYISELQEVLKNYKNGKYSH